MANKAELEIAIKSVADGAGLDETNEDLIKARFNANQLSEKQYNVIVKAVEEGKSLNEISQDLKKLAVEEKEVAREAREAARAVSEMDKAKTGVRDLADAFGVTTAKVDILRNTLSFARDFIVQSTAAARESAMASAELGTALENTGGKAGVTQKQLEDLATKIQETSLFTDEEVQHTQALMLSYQNIGGETIPRATQAIADMGQVMGSLDGATQLLGRALDAPAEASSRLERAGIRLSDAQQQQIDSFVKLGDVASAQEIILDAIEGRYAGQAQAARDAAGPTADLAVAYGDLQEQFGGLLAKLGDAGAADAAVSFLDKVAGGASAWQGVIDNMNLLAEAQAKSSEQSEETTAALERYKEANIAAANAPLESALSALIGWWYEAAPAVEEVATATTEAIPPTDIYAASVARLALDSADAAVAQDELARATLSAQSAALSGTYGASDDFTGQRIIKGFEDGTEAGKTYRDQQAKDAEAAARDQEKASEKAAREMSKSFERAADEIGNTIGSQLQTTFQDVFKLPDVGNQNDEPARRLATIARDGFKSEWIDKLGQEFGGEAFWQPIAQAIQGGNQETLKGAATDALRNFANGLVPQLWDKEAIKNKIRQEAQAENIKQELTQEIAKELGATGVAQSIGIVNIAAGDVKAAQGQVATGAADMSAAVVTSGAQMADGFKEAENILKRILQQLRDAIGYTDIWNRKTGEVAASYNTVGVGASNNPQNAVPNQAQQKMGPNRMP